MGDIIDAVFIDRDGTIGGGCSIEKSNKNCISFCKVPDSLQKLGVELSIFVDNKKVMSYISQVNPVL
ncbi:MAG TPA: hypothetical protein VIM70_03480 [Clostridium sp.]|uniref:hypothetical protein n=1 Tax=Clostridium sp. TaxID=1506 RepID=UPI002F9441D7